MRSWIPIAALLTALLPLGACGRASSSSSGLPASPFVFKPQTAPSTVGPSSLAVADFNKDGTPDLATAGYLSDRVSITLNITPTGDDDLATISPVFLVPMPTTTLVAPKSVAQGDFNGDGLPDLVVAYFGDPLNSNHDNGLAVFQNITTPGSTTLAFQVDKEDAYSDGTAPQGVAVGDLNNDGIPDIAFAETGLNTIATMITIPTSPPASLAFNGATSPVAGTFPAAYNPSVVAMADLNGDGRLDLVVADSGTTSSHGWVTVLFNNTAAGATSAAFASPVHLDAGVSPSAVTTADVNLDGRPDLLITNFDSSSLTIYLSKITPGAMGGTAAQLFQAPVSYGTRSNPWGVVGRDFNGDGTPDLAVANYGQGMVSIFINETAPGATTPTLSSRWDAFVSSGPDAIAAADFNGDGLPDLATACYNADVFSVLLNQTPPEAPTPDFALPTHLPTGNGSSPAPRDLAIAEFNGDGNPDFVAVNPGDTVTPDTTVFLNSMPVGSATVTAPFYKNLGTGVTPSAVAVTDFNGDGKLDLVVSNEGDNTVRILLNNTTTGNTVPDFPNTADISVGVGPRDVAVADFNGDGRPDFATANSGSTGSNAVTVCLNTTTLGGTVPACGTTASFTAGNAPQSLAAADFNLDGMIDIAVVNLGDETITLLRNDTAPGSSTLAFPSALSIVLAGDVDPVAIATADFNGDGLPDLVTANRKTGEVCVLLNKTVPGSTTIAFAPPGVGTTFGTGTFPTGVCAADLNADGRPDLVTANNTANTVSVLLNETVPAPSTGATPAFAAKADFTAGTGPRAVLVRDLNRDGIPDILVANEGGAGSVSILLGVVAPP